MYLTLKKNNIYSIKLPTSLRITLKDAAEYPDQMVLINIAHHIATGSFKWIFGGVWLVFLLITPQK